MNAGVSAYAEDVRARRYPGPEHTYSIDPAELAELRALLSSDLRWHTAEARAGLCRCARPVPGAPLGAGRCWCPRGPGYSIRRRTRAGAPAAIENGSMSCVTTLLAPITQRSPIVTPLVTTTFAPSQQLSPMRVGPLL